MMVAWSWEMTILQRTASISQKVIDNLLRFCHGWRGNVILLKKHTK